MFKSLKEKLSGWFKKEPEKEEKPVKAEKVEKKPVKKTEKAEIKKPEKKPEVKQKAKEKAKVEKKTEVKKETKKVKEVVADVKERVEADEEILEKKEEIVEAALEAEEEFEEKEVEETRAEVEEKVAEVKEEVKVGFFGRIKKAFVGEEKTVEVDEADEEILEKKEEIVEAALEAEEEFEHEDVEDRAKELKEELEEKEVERAKAEEEPLSADEVEEEIEAETGFFGKLARRLTTSELAEKDFDEFFDEFEFTLLEHNVALGVVDKIRENLKGNLVGKHFGKKEVEGKILGALKSAIDSVLIEPGNLIEMIKAKGGREPFVILFFGINGSGKTTSVAKLAYKLEQAGFSVVMAAGDTFRAASIEQLQTHGERLGIEVIKSDYGKDPASVAFDAIVHAKKHKKQVVLIDTAGRMYTKSNLMKEMEKIVKVSKPDLKLFVGESITGNDATEQAKMFHETAGIDGIILSKADVDEKAGTILSVSYVTGKPIFFLGVGQKYEDLQEFSKKGVLEGLGLD